MIAAPHDSTAATGWMRVCCAWCGVELGHKPCAPEHDGAASHGICPRCAEVHFGRELADQAFEVDGVRLTDRTRPRR